MFIIGIVNCNCKGTKARPCLMFGENKNKPEWLEGSKTAEYRKWD